MLRHILLICAVFSLSQAKSLIVGQVVESGSIHQVGQKIVEKYPLPFIKRTDELTFEVESPHLIRGISVRDAEEGAAQASLIAGGLGFNFVKIKLKSERGGGYKFFIQIYV